MYPSSFGCSIKVQYSLAGIFVEILESPGLNQPSVPDMCSLVFWYTAKDTPTYSQLNRPKTLFYLQFLTNHAFLIAAHFQHNTKGLSCSLLGNHLQIQSMIFSPVEKAFQTTVPTK